jgi:LysR family transcriptional regulator, carnitine catabolism transcriptional activator
MEFTSRQLRGFHLVAEHRSFSRAAEALFITPSGLSLLIRELEQQLGFRLFERTTRYVALTPLGAELLEVSRRSVQTLDAAVARLGQAAKGVTLTIAVGVTPLVGANVLPPAIREFRGRRPDVSIRLYDGDLKAILRRVQAGRLDMGLGIFRQMPGLVRRSFFRFSLVLIRAEQDGPPSRGTMAWSGLDGQPLISLSPDNPTQELIDRQLDKAGVTCPHDLVVNLLDTQMALVEAGQGMAIIPSFGLPMARQRKLAVTRLVEPTVHLDFHQIGNRAKPPSEEAEEFSAFLKSYVSRWADRSGVV